jgi:hypothetical protein
MKPNMLLYFAAVASWPFSQFSHAATQCSQTKEITSPLVTGREVHAATNCSQTEEIFFNCRIEKSTKVLSICGKTHGKRYAQYRFGRPGEVELSYPQFKTGSFSFFDYEFSGTSPNRGNFSVQFSISSYEYSVFSESYRNSSSTSNRPKGVRVISKTGEEVSILCAQSPTPIVRLQEFVDEIRRECKKIRDNSDNSGDSLLNSANKARIK